MLKRLISVCIIVILIFNICGCAQTAENTLAVGTETLETEYTETEGEDATDTGNAEKIAAEEEQTKAAQRQWQVYIQPDMPEPFIEVLKQYEDFMNADVQSVYDDDVCSKLNVTYDEWYLCYELCESLKSILELYAEDATAELEIYSYSLTDLTGDGFPELIMGRDSDFGTDNDYLYVVFYYSETEGIKMMDTTRYFDMSLYEGGIIEYISAGMSYTMTYLQYQEETESWEQAACIIVDWDYQSETKIYYHGVNLADFSDPDNEPMSEEEYREIVERYTAEPVELEWIPLFSGKATEDEAKSQKDEPVTVIAKVNHYYTDESLNSGSEYEYDSSGNLTRRTNYDANGSVDGWSEWEYDSLGNLMRQTRYDADGKTDYWYEYEYDSAGNQVKWISYDADGNINYWYEYGYDSAGNQVKEISYNTESNINFWYGYGYDSAGNQVKRISYNANGKTDYWYECEYDSIGNLTKEIYYNADDSIGRWYEYGHDSAGNLIRQAQYNADGSNYGTRTEWDYDTEGKLMRCISYDVDGSIVDRYEYKYDSEGNLTEEVNCGNNSSTYFRTEYEYDSTGNLTKVTEYYLSHRIEFEYITITPQ